MAMVISVIYIIVHLSLGLICGPILLFWTFIRGDLEMTMNFPLLYSPGFQVWDYNLISLLIWIWYQCYCCFIFWVGHFWWCYGDKVSPKLPLTYFRDHCCVCVYRSIRLLFFFFFGVPYFFCIWECLWPGLLSGKMWPNRCYCCWM